MRPDRIEREILEQLAEEGPLHMRDLNEIIDAHPASVDHACTRLHDGDQVFQVALGVYDITTQGQQRFEEQDDGQQEIGPMEG